MQQNYSSPSSPLSDEKSTDYGDTDKITESNPTHHDCQTGCHHHEAIMPVRKGEKIGRNDPCPCESGKKYKKCCLI